MKYGIRIGRANNSIVLLSLCSTAQEESVMKKKISLVLALVMCLIAFAQPIKVDAMTTDQYLVYAQIFDADYYYAAYPDVAAKLGPNYGKLLSHFVNVGMYEGRSGSLEFNPSFYREMYKDLRDSYGDNMYLYCAHYVNCGKAEGRLGNSPKAPKPKITTSININMTSAQVLATRTTTYNAKIPRATNVGLAASAMDGTIVMPGEQFSYNAVVGPRTKARGYVMATVYSSGTVTTGIGGGICQVSSTLYAAMKDCGLPATERHQHSLPVHYLPSGYDATVSYGSLDLKFVNIYQQPIMIKSSAVDGKLTVDLLLLN